MHDSRRVDLIFPRSGQVLPIYVPETMVEWVVRRNLQILLSLCGNDAPRSWQVDYLSRMHPRPS